MFEGGPPDQAASQLDHDPDFLAWAIQCGTRTISTGCSPLRIVTSTDEAIFRKAAKGLETKRIKRLSDLAIGDCVRRGLLERLRFGLAVGLGLQTMPIFGHADLENRRKLEKLRIEAYDYSHLTIVISRLMEKIQRRDPAYALSTISKRGADYEKITRLSKEIIEELRAGAPENKKVRRDTRGKKVNSSYGLREACRQFNAMLNGVFGQGHLVHPAEVAALVSLTTGEIVPAENVRQWLRN